MFGSKTRRVGWTGCYYNTLYDKMQTIDKINPEKLYASHGRLDPVLVKAVQELSAENTALKARLDAAGL